MYALHIACALRWLQSRRRIADLPCAIVDRPQFAGLRSAQTSRERRSASPFITTARSRAVIIVSVELSIAPKRAVTDAKCGAPRRVPRTRYWPPRPWLPIHESIFVAAGGA